MTRHVRFDVAGQAVPQGSLRRGGGRSLRASNADVLYPWREHVAHAARDVMRDEPIMTGSVQIVVAFSLQRPTSHYTTKGVLSRGAPIHATNKPDVDKLARAVLDALTGVVYLDDKQIVDLRAAKRWTSTLSEGPRISVDIWEDPRE